MLYTKASDRFRENKGDLPAMSIEKKSLISSLKTTKKANVASTSTPEASQKITTHVKASKHLKHAKHMKHTKHMKVARA